MIVDNEFPEDVDKIEAIVKSHKSGKVAFHVAHHRLMEEHGFDSDNALEALFPPLGEGDFDIDIPYDPNDIMQLDLTDAMKRVIDVKGVEEE